MTSIEGRLIPFRKYSGTDNMSLDQTLQEVVDRSKQPTLRFYGWQEPTLSLGYFQSNCERGTHQASQSSACVRRATGGGAILHHQELTYSIIVPQAIGRIGPSTELYREIHASLIAALLPLGVVLEPFHRSDQSCLGNHCDAFLCFQRRTSEDLILNGYKVVGSAQRKSKASILQHGSLLLNASQCAPELPGVNDLLNYSLQLDDVVEAVLRSLSSGMGLRFHEKDFTAEELERARSIGEARFNRQSWLLRR